LESLLLDMIRCVWKEEEWEGERAELKI
jgi:hypothetical protein